MLLEARACGTAIVATAIGGIPEQVAEGTGVLTEPGNPTAFADAIARLLENDTLREAVANDGLRHVQENFTLMLQARRFLAWYDEILHA